MDKLIETFKEGWLDEEPRLVCSVLIGIVLFITLSIQLGRRTKKRQKLKDNAIKNGIVIKGQLTYHYNDRDKKDTTPYYGQYTYTVNGEQKKYPVHSDMPLPNIIDLYPKNKSMTRFFSDYDRTTNAVVPLNAVISIALSIFILWITGYITF